MRIVVHQGDAAVRRGSRRGPRRRPRAPRRWVRALVWLVVAVVGALAAASGVAALRLAGVASDLRAARTALDAAAVQLQDGHVSEARVSLGTAREILVAANGDLYGTPDLAVVEGLPVLGANVDVIRKSVSTALGVAGAAEQVLRAAQPLEAPDGDLEVPLRGGAIPLATVADVRTELQGLLAALPAGPPSSSPFLLPQVRQLETEVLDAVERRRGQVTNLAAGLAMLEEVTGGNGDRRYLIAVANTAEMRGTGGMILSYGVLDGHGGDIELPAFGPVDEIFLDAGVDPAAVDAADDELARWDGLEPLRLWRNANLVPDPAVVAPRLEAMAEAAMFVPFDGVIQIDPEGLAAVLAGVGPVEVPGLGTVSAENVVDLTLNRAYTLFPESEQRREVLGDVAELAFRRLVDGEYQSLRPLGEALAQAAAERHIAIWSERSGVAQPASLFEADAAIPAADDLDHLLLTVQNFGRDKLDYYLDTDVRVRGARPGAAPGSLTVELTLTNSAPAGETRPAYVFGDPSVGRDGPIGHYLGVASVYVPVGTGLVGSSGDSASPPRLMSEGGRSVIGFDVDVAPGGSVTVVLELSLPPRPPGPYQLRLAPLPRVRPTTWDVRVSDGDGGEAARTGPLVRQEVLATA